MIADDRQDIWPVWTTVQPVLDDSVAVSKPIVVFLPLPTFVTECLEVGDWVL